MKSSQWRALVAQNVKKQRDAKLAAVTAPPKFCKDCAYHSCEFDRVKGKIKHYCAMPSLLNVVTGEKSHPASNRNSETMCGREARHFVPRRAVIEQSKEVHEQPALRDINREGPAFGVATGALQVRVPNLRRDD